METDGRRAGPPAGSPVQGESSSRTLLRRPIVTDASCRVVDRKDYEPYGVEIRPATNSAGNTHPYTGHERDERSGLDYMHYRFFGSNLGRFMKPDNVPGDLTTPQSWNLYAYALGSPVNVTDPTGHMVGQAWGYKMSGSGVLQNNGLGGGLNLGGHPFDDNPKGVIDWAIIDDVKKFWSNSVVIHHSLAAPSPSPAHASWDKWFAASELEIQMRWQSIQLAVINVSSLFCFFGLDQEPPNRDEWRISCANFYNSASNADTFMEAPYDTVVYDNVWMADTVYGWEMQGWDGQQELYRSFRDVSFALELLVIHEYQHHINPREGEEEVLIRTSQVASHIYGVNPWQ